MNRADPLVRATNHQKKRYMSVLSSGYGMRKDFESLQLPNEPSTSFDLDPLNDMGNSL